MAKRQPLSAYNVNWLRSLIDRLLESGRFSAKASAALVGLRDAAEDVADAVKSVDTEGCQSLALLGTKLSASGTDADFRPFMSMFDDPKVHQLLIQRTPATLKAMDGAVESMMGWLQEATKRAPTRTQGALETDAAGWHKPGADPPPGFEYGPIKGTKKNFVRWIIPAARDKRSLTMKLKDGSSWGRQNSRVNCSVWFKSQQQHAAATRRKISESR